MKGKKSEGLKQTVFACSLQHAACSFSLTIAGLNAKAYEVV